MVAKEVVEQQLGVAAVVPVTQAGGRELPSTVTDMQLVSRSL